jgi:hypothetical protein
MPAVAPLARPLIRQRALPSAQDKKTPLEMPTIRQRAAYLLTNPWRNYLLPVAFLRRVMAKSASPLLAEAPLRPGGWRSMEFIYRNDEPVDWPDRQALRENPLSMAARNRRHVVTGLLSALIAEYAARAPVVVLGVGSGPGRHVQTAIVDSGIDPTRVNAYLIDRDDDALEYGRSLAATRGIADCVHFLRGDACRVREVLPDISANIVKVVGLAEYLTDRQLLELLDALRSAMAPGGTLVTHGLVDAYGTGRFLARVWNLRHKTRTARSLARLIESAGLRVTGCVTEPCGIYPVLTAVRVH